MASPNEIAEMLDVGLEHVGYHVRVLRDLRCIELVHTARRRGAIEHYYRALEDPHLIDRESVVVKLNDGGKLQGMSSAMATVSVDAPTPGGN